MQQTEVVELYNKGLHYIKTHDYERAKELLKGIALIFHDRMLIQKVIGSLEMMTGYPYLALKYWEPLIDKNVGVTEEQCELLRAQLPTYDKMQDTYSKAMQWVIIGQLTDAEQILSGMFDECKDVAIPTEMYRSYMMLLLQLGKGKRALELFQQAPQYVQFVSDLRILEVSAKKVAQDEDNVQPLKDPWLPEDGQNLMRSEKKKKKMRGSVVLVYNVAIAVLLLIVIIAFMSGGGVSNNGSVRAEAELAKQLEDSQKKARTLQEQLKQLQAEHDAAYEKLVSLETENAKLGDQLAATTSGGATSTPVATPTPNTTSTPAPAPAVVKPQVPVKPATPATPATPTKHTVGKGETLLSIARKYYGGSKTWEVIWEANKEQLIKSDPRNADNPGQYVPLGETLLIP